MTRVFLDMGVRRLCHWLVWLSATVLALGYLRELYVLQFGTGTMLKDLRQIALDTEHCLGSYYSSVLMVIAAILMIIIGQKTDTKWRRIQWYVLAVIFTAMSFDESISFHEVLIDPLRSYFSFSSYLHFAWIVPGALFVLAVGLAYIPFVFTMPSNIRNRVITAGALYVTGALGFEAIGGHFNSIGGFESPYYIMAFLAEESLEIVGLTLFATTLLKYLPWHFGIMPKEMHIEGDRRQSIDRRKAGLRGPLKA
jgi:hypothetical protein